MDKVEMVIAELRTGFPTTLAATTAANLIAELRQQLATAEAERDRAVKDAERYVAVRKMCCSEDGPTDIVAIAWMQGDEAAADAAIDAAIAAAAGGEGDGHG